MVAAGEAVTGGKASHLRLVTEELGPLYGPFPHPLVWDAAREAAGHPLADGQGRFAPRLTSADLAAAAAHRSAWRKAAERRVAKTRAAQRALLVHPNWENRRRSCVVGVPMEPTLKHPAWERETRHCGAPVVAYDTTDKRVTGFLYGACAQHLAQALADCPEREWRWTDGRELDRTSVEEELTLMVLGGLGARRAVRRYR